jgi:hypothetical protein
VAVAKPSSSSLHPEDVHRADPSTLEVLTLSLSQRRLRLPWY